MIRSGDLIPASDGLPARYVGVQSKEKLHYHERYCSIFNRGMQYKWAHRIYVDLFSGPGRCVMDRTGEEIDGSPVIAAKTVPAFTQLFLNDFDANAVKALRGRLERLNVNSVEYLAEDCNSAAVVIARQLDAIRSPSLLSLSFIDPTNWQIEFESVRLLSSGRRMDLIILFHHGSMKWAADYEPEALSRFFGDDPGSPEWHRRYTRARRQGGHTSHALLDHYRERLSGIGYVWFDDRVIVEAGNNGTPLYHMLFASKHRRGEDFWGKSAVKKSDGQLRMDLF